MLSTPRLTLRPFVLGDVPKVYAMSLEAGMRRWIPDQVYRDSEHAEQVVRALMDYTDRAPMPASHPYVLGIELLATRTLIGHVGLSPARGSIEVGYAIEDAQQGRGVATEAVTAMTAWGLTDLALPEILGIVATDNAVSQRVLQKSGFVRQAESVDSHSNPVFIYRCASLRRS